MNDPAIESGRWLRQAENDLLFARKGFEEGFFSQVCFLCQQAGEKAVKAVRYHGGERIVIGHSIHALLKDTEMTEADRQILVEKASLLDQYYIPARYPNGLPDGAPFEVFTSHQAQGAIFDAQALIDFAKLKIMTNADQRP
jgi:HEPN domain-containing protein